MAAGKKGAKAISPEVIEKRRAKLMKQLLADFLEARHAAGMSQGDVGKLCGLSVGEVCRFETRPDRNPTLKLLIRLASAMGKEIKITLQ